MQFTCGITPLMVAESNTQGGCDTRYAFIIVLCPDPYPGGGGGGGGTLYIWVTGMRRPYGYGFQRFCCFCGYTNQRFCYFYGYTIHQFCYF